MFQIVPMYENSSTGEQFKPTVGWGEDLKPLRFKNRLEKIYDLVKRSQKKRGLSLERMTLLMSQQLKTLDKELNKAIFVPVLEYQKSLRQFEPYCHHLMGLFMTFQRPAKESMVFQFRSGDGTSPVEAESAKSMLKSLPNRNPEVENFLAAYLLNSRS